MYSTSCVINIVEDCQRRWKALRERFVKQMKKRKKKSGEGAKVCVPWELLGHLEFLREFVKHRRCKLCDARLIMYIVLKLPVLGLY